MGKLSSSYSTTSCDSVCHGILLSFILLSHISFQLASCGSIVKFLPGFHGPLPFILETGYVGVGEGEEVQAFYYFIESENNPKDDPLMLWLTGGPGCSAISGLAFEIGPLAFTYEEYNGTLPNLVLRQQSWTKVSSIIFVDLPVFTGFTYERTESASQRSDWKLVHQVHQFLRKWLIDHPSFLSNEVYLGGDSYSGIPIPVIAQEISQANEKGIQPWINLQGYLLGNPITTRRENNYKIPFAHGMALISDELYQSLQENCKGEYMNVDTRNEFCSRDLQSFDEATSGFDAAHILEPSCEWLDTETSLRRYLIKKYPRKKLLDTHLKLPSLNCRAWVIGYFTFTHPLVAKSIGILYISNSDICEVNSSIGSSYIASYTICKSYVYFLCGYWANDDNVQSALHIRKGRIGKWHRCTFNVPNNRDIPSSYEYHVNLSRKGYRSLIYSGDHDLIVPFLETQAWIRSLNYSIVDDWRQWHTNDGQVAGYTRTYSNRVTFATVKGGGHTAPQYKPEECFAMYSRWISNTPL